MANPVKFYTDEHIAKAVARGLRQRGVDATTAAEEGMLGEADHQQLLHARQQQRVIVSKDDDYLRLHDAGFEHAGIVHVH